MLHARPESTGFTMVETVIAAGLGIVVILGLFSLLIMGLKIHKGVLTQQVSLQGAKHGIETLDQEIRLATRPLRVFRADGSAAAQGNRVEFSRLGETQVRRFELQAGADGNLNTAWDNRLVYDPNIAVEGDERVLVRSCVSPSDANGAFTYAAATQPLIVRMRMGDSALATGSVIEMQDAYTGMGIQGVEINITVCPRN